jgi:hypothetical protein
LEYGLRWNWNKVDGNGAEVGIADLEKGLWIDGKARLGYFYLERNLDVTTGNAAGAFGFMYGQPPVENLETEGSVCFTYAIPVITVGFSSVIRYQPVWLQENCDFLLSVANVNELMNYFTEPMVRTSILTAGIEYFGLSLQKPYLINPFAFASAGTQYSRNVTNDAYRCENLNEFLVPVVHTGFGLRLCLSEILPFWKNVDWGIEVAGNARFDVILEDGNRHSPDAFFSYAFYARDFKE